VNALKRRLIRTPAWLFLQSWAQLVRGVPVGLYQVWRRNDLRVIKDGIWNGRLRMTPQEAYHVLAWTRRAEKVPGDYAEVGVSGGGSAKLIASAAGNRLLHLFDTFTGLPSLDASDDTVLFSPGDFAVGLAQVQAYLGPREQTAYYPGIFPGTAGPVADRRFAFVHLDMDLYEGTLGALEFFYPRLSPGAILVSHDYEDSAGVRKAFDEFFADKPEPVLDLAANQCVVVKVGAG
jgi:O-methyltransferase